MDHRSLVANLEPDVRAELTARSDIAGLRHLVGHVEVLVIGATWIFQGWPLWWFVLVPYGIALVFLFTLAHEATHKTPFRSVWLNEVAGHMSGLVLLLPFEWFRLFHLAHHKHTNDPERDPELAGPRPDTWPRFMAHVSGVPYWIAMVRVLMENAGDGAKGDYVPERSVPRLRGEARAYVVIYAAAAASLAYSSAVFWLWVLPVVLGQPFLRLYLLAEHGRCPQVANMLENSRTTFTNRIVRFLAWNMPYHAEHHAYPTVPFHRLPALHTHTRDHLKTTSDGYPTFVSSYVSKLH